MGKVLIVYFSKSGSTETMAQYIGEGVRIAGHEADVRSISEIKEAKDLSGYDGYIFGAATYHLEIPQPFENFLTIAAKADLQGKVGGAFSSRAHPSSGEESTAALIFDRMESGFNMKMTNLGPFDLKPEWLEGGKPELVERAEGMRSCQDYGKAIGETIGTR